MPQMTHEGHFVDLKGEDPSVVRTFVQQVRAGGQWNNCTLHAAVHRTAVSRGTSQKVVTVALEALKAAAGGDHSVSLETYETEVRALTRDQRDHALLVAMELVTAASVPLD